MLNNSDFLEFALLALLKFIRCVEINSQYTVTHIKSNISSAVTKLLVLFFKKHTLFRFNNLTELTIIDNPTLPNRFSLYAIFTSIEFNNRIAFNFPIKGSVITTFSEIYPNSTWSEREARDMFGIHFINNSDLRRLLTDYGFEGFPLRKDFPLTGYLEVRYDDEAQRVLYEKVELSQEFRVFNLTSPWEKH